jgi:hypothetical protein
MVPAFVITGHLKLVRRLARRDVEVRSVGHEHLQTAHLARYSVSRFRSPHPLLAADRGFDGPLLIPMFVSSLSAISRYKDAPSDRYLVAVERLRHLRAFYDWFDREGDLFIERWRSEPLPSDE